MTTYEYNQLRKYVRQGDALNYIREAETGGYTIHWCASTGEVPSEEPGYYVIIGVAVDRETHNESLTLDFAYWDGNKWYLNAHSTGSWFDTTDPLGYVVEN